MKKFSWALVLVALSTLPACTRINVKPVSATQPIKKVCIRYNPAVKVSDFVMVMQDGFQRHGIQAEVFHQSIPASCQYVVSYTALRSWDFKPYLSHAEIRINDHGRLIASAEYHLNGGGGLDLGKWASTRKKIGPVMDKMLAGIQR